MPNDNKIEGRDGNDEKEEDEDEAGEEDNVDGGTDGAKNLADNEGPNGTENLENYSEETDKVNLAEDNGGEVKERKPQEIPRKRIVEAKAIYILMSKEYRISRNRRAEWFFNHVNTCMEFPDWDKKSEKDDEVSSWNMKISTKPVSNGSSDFEVVSIVPLDPPPDWNFETRHSFRYHVNPETTIMYLSRRYRIVFCLDISPSVASVDVQSGGVIFDNIFKALQASLRGLLQPFLIPGTRRSFRPEIFLTVIAHTPFFTPVTDQILIQGQILDNNSCESIIRHVFDKLNEMENKVARLVKKRVHQLRLSSPELDITAYNDWTDEDEEPVIVKKSEPKPQTSKQRRHHKSGKSREGSGGGVGGSTPTQQVENSEGNYRLTNSKYASFAMSPDFGLLDLLRQALIALSLMPENSSAGLVILTDGVISVPDGRYLDIILSQLRYNTVSCSFIQLSSRFHPHLCYGVIPYSDLLKFISSATFGAFLYEAPEIKEKRNAKMNVYHNAFLAWSFHKTLETEWNGKVPPRKAKQGQWSVRNKCFSSVRDMPIVKKQQYEDILHVDHMKVLSCRLREGFTIKEVVTAPDTGLTEVTLILPWKFLIHLEYKIFINPQEYMFEELNIIEELEESGCPRVRCVVNLEGPYDFLHDVTCLAKKPFSSLYRQLMVNRFWATRKNLSESDRLLVHLNSFSSNNSFYNIPESLKNGMPLFYWSQTNSSATPQLHSNELAYTAFAQFWKPVCLLDTTVWQKWMHTHRIGIILEHDYPLPKNLYLPNSAGRFNVIQCRQAVMALNTLLKNMSSFVLLENQSYVHLMFESEDDKVPHSFCLIRVTSKPPHVVLRLAFLIGTPGYIRHHTVAEFRERIQKLTFPQRVKDPPKWRVIMNTPVAAKAATTASPLVNKTAWSDMPCCALVHKPVEKILIRYDKCPDDFRRRLLSREEASMYVPEEKSTHPKQSTFGFRPTYQTAPVGGSTSIQMLPEVFNTIARYLHHRRWIWWFPGGEFSPQWASEILTTITKMRLEEGFRFAYSSSGITNMVLELPLKHEAGKRKMITPMVLQFVIFPPRASLTSEADDFDSYENASNLYLVTECWVEPQCGLVTDDDDNESEKLPVVCKDFLKLNYKAIPELLLETDQKCVSLVGTFEYLVRICKTKEGPFLVRAKQKIDTKPVIEENETVNVMPFEFDLRQILLRSRQLEMLFSTFYQDLSLTFPNEWNANVCTFFERSNSVLYQQWISNIARFQDKEVHLTSDQHEVATMSVVQRKDLDALLELQQSSPSKIDALNNKKVVSIQWRCFVRSNSSTHVVLTLVPASFRDMKKLLLQLDLGMDCLHKTKSSRYVSFLDESFTNYGNPTEITQCPNQFGNSNADSTQANSATFGTSTVSSLSSPQLVDHNSHQPNCRCCQISIKRKRVRAFSGGNECGPAPKKYLTSISVPSASEERVSSNGEGHISEVSSDGDQILRSQTFSEGTVSGKLAQFILKKRSLHEQTGGSSNANKEQNDEQKQQIDNMCSDPQRCRQLSDYLNTIHGGLGTGTGSGSVGGVAGGGEESQRYVPCRPPVIGSLAFCLFTYSCSLFSLTDHVVFRKMFREELSRDFRLSKDGLAGAAAAANAAAVNSWNEFYLDQEDDDDVSTESGSLFPNARSMSQESFSESTLQRLEVAEQELMLKSHCFLLKQAHLQSFISSAYKSLLSGYTVTSSDVQAVIERCALTSVNFPLDNFLQYVCAHQKDWKSILMEMQEEDEECENSTENETQACCHSCKELDKIHQFIRRRFRRLLSRNFTPTTDNGHVLFYKIASSNALSDVSGVGMKCSSDIEDNFDSCSILAESLYSADEPYRPLTIIPSDIDVTDKSLLGFLPSSAATGTAAADPLAPTTGRTTVADDQQSYSEFTTGSLPASTSALNCQYSPLFCYLTCGLQIEQEEDDEKESGVFIPLMDMPTCFRELCWEHIRTLLQQSPMDVDELLSISSAKFKLTMELTFLTCPEYSQPAQHQYDGDGMNSDSSKEHEEPAEDGSTAKTDKLVLSLANFKKRLSIKQNIALDHMIRDIEWLMEDEIVSFRGGGGGNSNITESTPVAVLESITSHIEKSLDKPGCMCQQIQLSFVEHSDEKGFQSFLERFRDLTVDGYSFQQAEEAHWWYLVSRSVVDKNQDLDGAEDTPGSSTKILPPFWIIVKACSPTLLRIYHHCRYDETDLKDLTFSRRLRVDITDLISKLIRTINQDLLLQQLHGTKMCSPLLEVEDMPDLDEVNTMDLMMGGLQHLGVGVGSTRLGDSESDISSTIAQQGNFCPGMFHCQTVWMTTFNLHPRLRTGGGRTAFARGIQTLRSTLTAFEVTNRLNMFVYRDASGNVFYMRFFRGVDVLESTSSGMSPSKGPLENIGDDYPDSEVTSMASDSSSAVMNRLLMKRTRNADSESEKVRDDTFDGILALRVYGIVPAGDEIKEQLVQSLRNKLDDAVLDILSATLKRNPHCKLTPEDVHFLQEPRSRPDSIFKFKLTKYIVGGHLPAFSYYLHQNLLQFLSMPKYTSQKGKYHFQDYSRLQDEILESGGDQSSVYLYNQSPGGGGTGSRGIAIVSMALTDKIGNLIKNPEWRQPQLDAECKVDQFQRLIQTNEVNEEIVGGGRFNGDDGTIMVEFNMWKQGRINFDLLKNLVEQAIKHAGWDLMMEFKLLTAPLSVTLGHLHSLSSPPQSQEQDADESVFEDNTVKTDDYSEVKFKQGKSVANLIGFDTKKRRSSHLNPTRSNSTGGPLDEEDEPRMRSMSFTSVRKPVGDGDSNSNDQGRDRAPSPIPGATPGRIGSEGSRPRVLLSRSSVNPLSLTKLETGEIGKLHSNYSRTLDCWLENGIKLTTPSVRRIVIPLNCRYPVRCIIQELEKIVTLVAPDNTSRQFWKHGEGDYVSCAGHATTDTRVRRDSCGDEYSHSNSEYLVFKRHEQELLGMEGTEEAEYPSKLLGVFRKNERFQPGYKGHICYLIARNMAHWKSCVNSDTEFAVQTSQDFKNLYKYPPLLNENTDIDGSRGSIEKLPRTNFAKEFVLWSGSRSGNNSLILIPRQRFLRARVTCNEIDFVVYNWSKECCERLHESVNYLSHWIQARASLLSSLLLQKSGLFHCQPILPDNFASNGFQTDKNPFLTGDADVDLKDLVLNSLPNSKHDRWPSVSSGSRLLRQMLPPPPIMKPTQIWTDFYRNLPLRNLLGMPELSGDNPVDAHGKQLLHVLNAQNTNREPDNTFFQYWLTRGPSASNVITTQALESFRQAARTIHFCLTPIMFLPSWRAAVAQTRDSSSAGGIIRKNRGSSRRSYHVTNQVQISNTSKLPLPPATSARMRHGSEASQASSLSLRNRSRSYHSGMVPMLLHPEVISERDFERDGASSVFSMSPQQQQQQNLFLKVKTDEPWHAVLCKTFLQEYMQYLQTLGFVPVHYKPNSSSGTSLPEVSSPSPRPSTTVAPSPGGIGILRRAGLPIPRPIGNTSSPPTPPQIRAPHPGRVNRAGININTPLAVKSASGSANEAGGSTTASSGEGDNNGGEEDERMIHFLQRCLPGGIIVIEVGLTPPFFYCKIHALEAKRIFLSKNNKAAAQNPTSMVIHKNAVQFVDECEKMKVLTHLHSFMYDFHLRTMYLYISGRQLLFKTGYHITTFLDDFITYYPKCPNFSRNAVHIGLITLEDVITPSQVLFNYILSHDKHYRMKVIRMTPFNPGSGIPEDSSSEYVLVHNMSRKVSYWSGGEDQLEQQQQQQPTLDEFDLTLVIAHDYPTSSRDFIPDYNGLRVKYYIVLTSRKELYPKGGDLINEPSSGKLHPVYTPEPLCIRSGTTNCSSTACISSALSKLVPPPAPPPSYFEGFEGGVGFQHHHFGSQQRRQQQYADMIREEKVSYMGYFSSHEQLMQKVIDEQKEAMEHFIRQLITKAAVDCRRDLLWQRLLIGKPQAEVKIGKGGKAGKGPTSVASLKEDIISKETVGPLYFKDFNELLSLVQLVPVRDVDPRLEELLAQPMAFYQALMKVLGGGCSGGGNNPSASTVSSTSGLSHPSSYSSSYNYREFSSPDQQFHQLAIFSQDAHKSLIMIEINMKESKCDIFLVFKDGKKAEQQQQCGTIPVGEMGDALYSLVERVINACCFTTWISLI